MVICRRMERCLFEDVCEWVCLYFMRFNGRMGWRELRMDWECMDGVDGVE